VYGLKQASKTWCHNFQQTIQMYGFNKSTVNHSTFIYSKGQIMVIAPLYVDDRYCSDWKFRTSHLKELKLMLHQSLESKTWDCCDIFLELRLIELVMS